MKAYSAYEHFYVLNDKALLPHDMSSRTHFITHSERDWKQVLNLYEAWRILRAERPNVILSTGASPAIPFAIVGKLLFRTRVIFIETITRVRAPSLAGRLMYWLADEFFYQWESLRPFFPRGRFLGRLI